jgi:glycerol-3-phosphate dehydrogenase
MKSRAESLREISGRIFDLCIIGGGATGAGCALDAQLRGLSTVLIDARDFAGATSSASTKLAHGGVRYLQEAVCSLDFGQIPVIRRALHERICMLRNAPHLAHACEFLIPTYRRFEAPYYALGMKIYEWMAGSAKLAPSRMNSRSRTLEELPDLNPAGLAGSVTYVDGQFDDARFGLALVESFVQASGCAANYLKLTRFEHAAGRGLSGAESVDQLTGQPLQVRARAFINATGPFSDHVRLLANPHLPPRLALSRGVHILLPLDPESEHTALLIPKTADGRVVFAIPWLGRLLVGTTDDEVSATEPSPVMRDEADYLLRYLNHYLARPRRIEDVVSAFSGVRPLVRSAHVRETKKLIRDHEVELDSVSGLISVLGGKWTTYRAMAEDAIDLAQQRLGQPVRRSGSDHYLLAGARGYRADYWKSLVIEHRLSEGTARHLTEKYGTRSPEVLSLASEDPQLAGPIVAGASAIRAEIVFSIRREMAMTIEDILARRIGLQYYSWRLAAAAAPIAADYLARELSWSNGEESDAVQEYVSKIAHMQAALASAPVRS